MVSMVVMIGITKSPETEPSTSKQKTYTATVFIIKVSAPGKEFLTRFVKNFPFTGSSFGKNAKKNDGIPMTNVSSMSMLIVRSG